MSKPTRWTPKDSEPKQLPIYQHKNKLTQAVRTSTFLIVTGETGSGKTTQLPQYLHQAGKMLLLKRNFIPHLFLTSEIGITQPRRVAAITVAQRVAQEMKCTLGREVGYQVRFDDCTSQDILLGLLKNVFSSPSEATKGRSFPLKVVVMSATSEAQQRAGRAGRTSSGKCFRIYTKEFWEKCMPEYTIPEIQRTSLTAVILTLKCLGVHDVIRFPYLDCPEERFILEALKQLYQFDAIDRVTKLGELMVEFPLHPGLTRALLKAASLGCQDLLLPVAAMLSVENIFIRPGQLLKLLII
ncbi:hypothetical protein XENOCAPTIV_005432 [Xenoophorus captivus]|uniref:Helicase-associated domain-containing protein n=1 Tax=Xenoophorus captivus TaxID=1517983 RepID=A0ABV0R720_9TELE